MADPAVVLSVFLSFFGSRIPEPQGGCIRRTTDRIVEVGRRGEEEYGVPAGVLFAVGFSETHLGCARNEGGNWGAPISATQRHVAGPPIRAAHILARGYRHCGDWRMAIAFFRSGLCRPFERRHIAYRDRVSGLALRTYRSLHEAPPSGLEQVQVRASR